MKELIIFIIAGKDYKSPLQELHIEENSLIINHMNLQKTCDSDFQS